MFWRVPPQIFPRRAFTIIEMLVVIAVIGMLAGALFPAMRMMKREADNAACLANLRQSFIAIEAYTQASRDTLPMCEFVPVVTNNGPEGGLPAMLRGYISPESETWKCPCDLHEDSLATGTSYLYLPGLLRYTPAVQVEVGTLLTGFAPGTMTMPQLQSVRLDAEARLMTTFFRGNAAKFPLLMDSEDRHERATAPRNGVYLDGSVRPAEPPPETETLRETDAPVLPQGGA